VIVPAHRRRDHKVAGRHHRALAIDGGMGTLAFEDEAQRGLRMAMRRRDFAGEHGLNAGEEGGRDSRLPAEARIFQDKYATLRFFCADQLARFRHALADRIETPEERLARALRLRGDQGAEHVPQSRQIFTVDLFVESLALGRLLDRVFHLVLLPDASACRPYSIAAL